MTAYTSARRLGGIAVAGAALLTFVVAMPPSAVAGSDGWAASYTSPYTPAPDRSTSFPAADRFNDVLALSPTSVLAGGVRFDNGRLPVLQQWDGQQWQPFAPQPPATSNGLDSPIDEIAGTSLTDVWLVSFEPEDTAGSAPVIEHFDGVAWTPITQSGLPPYWTGRLVVRGGAVWLVGSGSAEQYLALHGSGAAFIARYVDDASPHWVTARYARTGSLTDVVFRTAQDGWAVGVADSGPFAVGQPLIEHWNGHTWRRELPNSSVLPVAVAATSGHSALAVGERHALRWNGTRWRRIAGPAGDHRFTSVTTDPAGGYWVSGAIAGHVHRTSYYRYWHGQWTRYLGPARAFDNKPGQSLTVTAMGTAGKTAWAVGVHTAGDCDDIDECPDNYAGSAIVDVDK